MKLSNWFSSTSSEVATIKASDGVVLAPTDVASLLGKMTTFAGGHAGYNPLTTTSTSTNSAYYGGTFSGYWH